MIHFLKKGDIVRDSKFGFFGTIKRVHEDDTALVKYSRAQLTVPIERLTDITDTVKKVTNLYDRLQDARMTFIYNNLKKKLYPTPADFKYMNKVSKML